MSIASDGCSSFNCMSALNDGTLNSYTFHTIAFFTLALARAGRVGRGSFLRPYEEGGGTRVQWSWDSHLVPAPDRMLYCTKAADGHVERQRLMKHFLMQTHTHENKRRAVRFNFDLVSLTHAQIYQWAHTLTVSRLHVETHTIKRVRIWPVAHKRAFMHGLTGTVRTDMACMHTLRYSYIFSQIYTHMHTVSCVKCVDSSW